MKTLLLLALVVATAFAGFSIDLQPNRINDQQYLITKGTGKDAKPVANEAPLQKEADLIYTFSPKLNGNDEASKAVFDTTVGQNWEFDTITTPKSDGKLPPFEAANGRATLVKAAEGKQNLAYGKTLNLEGVNVVKSNQIGENDNQNIFTAANLGLSLNRESSKNFFHDLEANKVKLEQGGQGFFFHLADSVNQIFFGLPNKFFASSELEKINAKNPVDNARWTIPVKAKGIALAEQNPLTYKDPVYATFDSTTQYIWANDDLVDSIVKSLNNKAFQCNDVHKIGLYECESSQEFPALQLTFQNNGEDTKTYSLTDYTEKVGDNKARLLIRKAAQYQKTTTVTRTPKLELNKSTQDLVLGTVFFKNVFTYFNVEDHSVSLAKSFNVVPEPLHLDNTWRYWFLALGTLLTLGLLGWILSLMTKVPFTKSAPVSLPPAIVSSVQQPSYVVTSQAPVYQTYSYVQQQQPVQLSPTRIVQTKLPQSYVQSQTGGQF